MFAEMILPEFDQEMATTLRMLQRVPDDLLDWRPHAKSNTIGWNANHLAEIPGWVENVLDESINEPWSLMDNSKTLFTMTRGAVMRMFVLSHLIHHRTILSVYYRLNDIPVPAIYGPSADEAE